MTDSELAAQLSDLDWGTNAQSGGTQTVPRPKLEVVPEIVGSADVQAADVEIAGVVPRTRVVSGVVVKRSHHKAKAPKARKEFVVADSGLHSGDRHAVGQDSAPAPQVPTESVARVRRPRDQPMDILLRRGESPAVMALFESMWREVGHSLALEVGRPKASKQDAALGWYMLLLAMRARDAKA